MKKILYSVMALAIAAMTFTACEDVPEPYPTPTTGGNGGGSGSLPYVSANLNTGWTLVAVTTGAQPWSKGTSYAQATGYQKWDGASEKSNKAVEGWLVSPAISTVGYENVKLSFNHTIKYTNNVSGWEAYHKVYASDNFDGSNASTATWKELPDAILCAWQAGQEGGNSVVDVLSGKQSPSGKFTMTWPVNFSDPYSSKNFPVDKTAKLDFMNTVERGNVKNVDWTDYEEDIYVGYRYFDSFDVPVSYPFGYGLSYTTFEYSDAKITEKGDAYEISVTVKNTGTHEGKEVVELYISAPDNKAANKPVKELKAFAKTKALKAGESETIILTVNAADLASFDEAASAWVVAAGEYQFLIGASSQDIKATLKAKAKAKQTKVNNVLKPSVKLNLLKR